MQRGQGSDKRVAVQPRIIFQIDRVAGKRACLVVQKLLHAKRTLQVGSAAINMQRIYNKLAAKRLHGLSFQPEITERRLLRSVNVALRDDRSVQQRSALV